MSEGIQHKLAAIVSADVVGYSRLMGADEAGTHARLKARFSELVEPKIAEHGGRVVKLMGDGLLAEFPSVISAANWAVAVQTKVSELNTDEPNEPRIDYRIGVNLGEVIIDGDDIFGDGVNVAARLQEIAEPGGVCISEKVHAEVRGKIDFVFVDGGSQPVKNIADPIHVWRWTSDGQQHQESGVNKGNGLLSVPDKPSIAVLPFDNMSGDTEQEYFADGISEDLITALSRLRWLFVIARNSTFHYKATSPDVRQVAKELGVRYVLEGSVRKAGNRVRITAQLIDAHSGNHIWADRFDRELIDIFDLQDELTAAIAAQVDTELAESEREVARVKPAGNLDAWDCYLRGMWHVHLFTQEGTGEATRLFKQSIIINPDFAPSHSGISLSHFSNAFLGFGQKRQKELAAAMSAARRSVECDEKDAQSHWSLGRAHLLYGEHEQAIAEFQESVTLNPNYALGYYNLGWATMLNGQPEKALEYVDKAYRLSPHDPFAYAFMIVKCQSYFLLHDFEKAWQWGERASRQRNAHFLIPAIVTAVAAAAGWVEKSENMKRILLELKPDFKPSMYLQSHIYKHREHHQFYLDAFAKAGLPE
jgi:adenylate cyclase